MPAEPLYDPDRMVPEDLDFSDPDVALAYLDHPVTERLQDDLGRSFRSMPPAEQQAELSEYLPKLTERRAQVVAGMEVLDLDAPGRPLLQQYLDALDRNVEMARLRLLELD